MKLLVALCTLFLSFSAIAQSDVDIYLIGDAGAPNLGEDPNLEYLKLITSTADSSDILIFLGDNLYPEGLPDEEHPQRKLMEDKLNASLAVMKAFPGRAIMIPGNHDWANAEENGWQQLRNMQRYVDRYMGKQTVFLPRGGCPGPLEVDVSPEILLVIMDTQYFLHKWDKPDDNDGCDASSTEDAIIQLKDLISRNSHKHVVVAGHHPMYSFGPHGSKYTFKQHLFPLTDFNRKLFIPLPGLGSIYPLFRSLLGSRQDLPNPRYKMVRNALVSAMAEAKNTVYVCGHEHSLQYIMRDSLHFVVSGSGSKISNVAAGFGTQFYAQAHGFAQLSYRPDDSVSLTFYNGDIQQPIHRQGLYQKKVKDIPTISKGESFGDSTVISSISTRYTSAGDTYNYWLGKNYRTLWNTPVEMPVFNIGTAHGGLEIKKLGGGNQTRSLRLEAANGRQYVLRSLDKYTERLLPQALHETLASAIVQDQISAANPYGAFAIPPLAEAISIYHTNPQLVYVPNDQRFGRYQGLFANLPVLYEERPNDEAAHEPYFGGGEKIEGTPDLIEILQEDNDEVVDQAFALRNRLFDMIIGDWDRHEDQWRWVRFDKEPKGHIWRPIPRDRDQAFFVSDGLIGWIAARRFALPNTEGFKEKMDYPPGFNTSARFFDRTFLNGLSWADWEKEISYIQEHLTDEVIDAAFEAWPDTIQALSAASTARILKARRDDMWRFARIHYEFISETVEIPCSDKHEQIEILRMQDSTRVHVYKQKKDGEQKQLIYSRTFSHEVTKELRVYGLGGEDSFQVLGEAKDGIKIRIIGGGGADEIVDESWVSGWKKHTHVYDLEQNTKLYQSRETRSHLDDDISINAYNRTAFKYNKLLPLLSAQFNFDDGLYLGAGLLYTKEGWRKEPFAARHKLQANRAFATGALNLNYEATFGDVIGEWDLNASFALQRPFGVSNFFGFGNESVFDFEGSDAASGFEDPIDYYRIRYEKAQSYINLTYNLGQNGHFQFGPEHLYFRMEDHEGESVIYAENSQVTESTLKKSHHFVGLRSELSTDTRNHAALPTRGVYAGLSYAKYYAISSRASDFTRISGDFRFLLSTSDPARLTIANRVGADWTLGKLQFFNGAMLGRENIRGYRRTRFIGRASFYHNLDARIRLFTMRTYLFPATIGILGFHDIGRVWLANEQSSTWHRGQGFGAWIAPINRFVFTFNLAFTNEENLPSVTFGFQF